MLVLNGLVDKYTSLAQFKEDVLYLRYVSVSHFLSSFLSFIFPFLKIFNSLICQTFIDIACPPLWGSWTSLLDTYNRAEVLRVLVPFIAQQWSTNNQDFRMFCEYFVTFHKTSLCGSNNQHMSAHSKLFNLYRKHKKMNEEGELAIVQQQLSQAALSTAVSAWQILFRTNFYDPLKEHLCTAFGVPYNSGPMFSPRSFDFSPDGADAQHLKLDCSAPQQLPSENTQQLFKEVIQSQTLKQKRVQRYNFIPDIFFATLADYDRYTFIDPLPWGDCHETFCASLLEQLKPVSTCAWLGRLVSTGKGAPLLQPGLLRFSNYGKAGMLQCNWLPGNIALNPPVRIPETFQYEKVKKWEDKNIPEVNDGYVLHPHLLFSKTLWTEGFIRMLPANTHTTALLPRQKRKREKHDPLNSPLALDKIEDAPSGETSPQIFKKGG